MEFFRKFLFLTPINFILCVGLFLRTFQYLYNRSLWGDEAHLAIKILSSSWNELLVYQGGQVAAPLFFVALKLTTTTFGSSDFVFRFIPFFSGVSSLFLFAQISSYFLTKHFRLIAVGLFCLLDNLIYYSSELKQYHLDVTLGLLIFWCYLNFLKNPTLKRFISFCICAVGVVWFSHSVLFCLSTIGIHFIITRFKHPTLFVKSIYFNCLWLSSFLIVYIFSTLNVNQNAGLKEFWQTAFMPIISTNLLDLFWLPFNLFRFCCYYLGLRLTNLSYFIDQVLSLSVKNQLSIYLENWMSFFYIIIFGLIVFTLFIFGSYQLFKKSLSFFWLLLGPVLFTLIASMLEAYPFRGRLLLFYFPYMTIILSVGVHYLLTTIKTLHLSQPFKLILSLGIVGLLFFHPVITAIQGLYEPRSLDYSKRILNYYDSSSYPNIIVSLGSNSMFYYCDQYDLDFKHLYIDSFQSPLSDTHLKTLQLSKGILSINTSKIREHDFLINYFQTFYTIKKHVSISNKASILYLANF